MSWQKCILFSSTLALLAVGCGKAKKVRVADDKKNQNATENSAQKKTDISNKVVSSENPGLFLVGNWETDCMANPDWSEMGFNDFTQKDIDEGNVLSYSSPYKMYKYSFAQNLNFSRTIVYFTDDKCQTVNTKFAAQSLNGSTKVEKDGGGEELFLTLQDLPGSYLFSPQYFLLAKFQADENNKDLVTDLLMTPYNGDNKHDQIVLHRK